MLRDDKGTRHSADSPARNCGQARGMPPSPQRARLGTVTDRQLHTSPGIRGQVPLSVARYTDAIGSRRVRSDSVRIGERVPADDQLMLVGGFDSAKVQMQRVEAAAVAGDAGRVLELSTLVPSVPTISRSAWRRHRLDVAWAYSDLHRYGDAVNTLIQLRNTAPVWLRQQRYARDIVESAVVPALVHPTTGRGWPVMRPTHLVTEAAPPSQAGRAGSTAYGLARSGHRPGTGLWPRGRVSRSARWTTRRTVR